MPGVRSVSVGALVAVGPKDEQPAERGFSHLIEHMVFQGTGMRDAGDIAEMMAIGGGAMGAFTAREYTVYHGTVLDDYVTFVLEVLGDMLGDSVLPEAALERQRRVILNELLSDDDPLERANDLLKATMWPDHPLGYPVAGQPASIRAATRAALVDFMQRHYLAPKLILSAAGSINHARFVELVRDSFWQMNGTAHEPADPGAPRFKSGGALPIGATTSRSILRWRGLRPPMSIRSATPGTFSRICSAAGRRRGCIIACAKNWGWCTTSWPNIRRMARPARWLLRARHRPLHWYPFSPMC